MPRCAFLTIADNQGWFIDDKLVHEPMRRLGWDIIDVIWNAEVDWDAYDVVVIRSPWDYQQNVKHFLSVLSQINASTARLYNPLDIVKSHIDKQYLFTLQRKGIEIVPTLKIEVPTPRDIEDAFSQLNTDHLVLKPTDGANADDTYRVLRKSTDSEIATTCESFSAKTCLVQPFVQGIISEGEYSLIYFDGRLSHAILKTVQQGDFRVQEEHGGGVVPVDKPEPDLIAAANRVIATLPEPPLYGRVDLVRTKDNTFALMELEVVEPALYFRFGEGSAQAFAQAIADRYDRDSAS